MCRRIKIEAGQGVRMPREGRGRRRSKDPALLPKQVAGSHVRSWGRGGGLRGRVEEGREGGSRGRGLLLVDAGAGDGLRAPAGGRYAAVNRHCGGGSEGRPAHFLECRVRLASLAPDPEQQWRETWCRGLPWYPAGTSSCVTTSRAVAVCGLVSCRFKRGVRGRHPD